MNERVLELGAGAGWREYVELCKPRVVALIVFTAVVGMLLASPGPVALATLLPATLGIGLGAACGAAFNHLADQQADRLMARTRRRPLPTGRLDPRAAAWFAIALGGVSTLLLVVQVNALTALLTLLSMVGYSVVYTLFLKRATPQNIVIGGAAGAMPPVLGWTAISGQIEPHALLLFLIIYTWTPPHFWALAIHRCEDYRRADIPMLPVTHGIEFTRLQILLYTVLLTVVTVLPYLTGMSGTLYLIVALGLDIGFLVFATRLYLGHGDNLPMRTFGYSIWYLMGIFAALLGDHYLR